MAVSHPHVRAPWPQAAPKLGWVRRSCVLPFRSEKGLVDLPFSHHISRRAGCGEGLAFSFDSPDPHSPAVTGQKLGPVGMNSPLCFSRSIVMSSLHTYYSIMDLRDVHLRGSHCISFLRMPLLSPTPPCAAITHR
jgi:hypothetical protein